jgi:hypothetical protein
MQFKKNDHGLLVLKVLEGGCHVLFEGIFPDVYLDKLRKIIRNWDIHSRIFQMQPKFRTADLSFKLYDMSCLKKRAKNVKEKRYQFREIER